MKNLISMVDFLPDHPYSKFLKQSLELWMFVPCDEDGNVLEIPIENQFLSSKKPYDRIKYQKAKERCLFDGFVWKKAIFYEESKILFPMHELDGIIEDLVKYDLQLTTTALKQIGI
jgi:hypothetical protein